MSEWMQRIIESKRTARREFAAQPFAEKLRILERLRDAAALVRGSPPRKTATPLTRKH